MKFFKSKSALASPIFPITQIITAIISSKFKPSVEGLKDTTKVGILKINAFNIPCI